MVIVVGLGATIGVLLSIMSMTTGIARAYQNAGDPGRAIVVSQGAESEGNSSISRAMAPSDHGRARHRQGQGRQTAGRPRLEHGRAHPARQRHQGLSPPCVGSAPRAWRCARNSTWWKAGCIQPGKRELMVGIGTQTMFQHMKIGDKIIMPDGRMAHRGRLFHRRHPGRPGRGRYRDGDERPAQAGLQFHSGAADHAGFAGHLQARHDHQSGQSR